MKTLSLIAVCALLLVCAHLTFSQFVGSTRDLGGNALGSNPCTFGPSYWCASPQNAARCGGGAIGFCLRTGQLQRGNGQQQDAGQQQQQQAVPLIGFASPSF